MQHNSSTCWISLVRPSVQTQNFLNVKQGLKAYKGIKYVMLNLCGNVKKIMQKDVEFSIWSRDDAMQ